MFAGARVVLARFCFIIAFVMGKDLINSVRDWLEKGGFPLELYAAKELRSLGFVCSKSQFYEDSESGKSREIDVVSWQSLKNSLKQTLILKLIVECKKSSNPFVVLCEKSEESRIVKNTITANWIMNRNGTFLSMAGFVEADKGNDYLANVSLEISKNKCRQGYSIVQAHQQNDSYIYGEIYKLVKAYQCEIKRDNDFYNELMSEEDSRGEAENSYDTHIPILLVDAPLVETYLDDNGNTIIEEKEISSISINLPWQDYCDNEVSVAIVKKEKFTDFAKDILAFHKIILDQQNMVEEYWEGIENIPEEKRPYTRLFKVVKNED